MKHENIISRAFSTIVIIIIAAVLLIAVFLVYRTFEKSVETDIFIYSRDLEFKIRRLTGAEYRRYFLLMDIGKTINSDSGEEAFRTAIEDKAEIFNREGEFPQLIVAIGYYDKKMDGKAYEFDLESGEWAEIDSLFSKEPAAGEFNLVDAGTDSNPGQIYLSLNSGDERILFFRLDRSGFIDTYIKETVESIDPELRFEWFNFTEKPQPPEDGDDKLSFGNEKSKYTFRPFSILFGIKEEPVPLRIEMPAFFDVRNILKIDSENEQKADDGSKYDHPPFLHTGIYVEILDKQGSFYYRIEREAAVSFFETVTIFIIVGILFFLLLSQLQRTRQMRNKEKEFVASVTHELRTPLTVIRSAADNLSTGIVPEEKIKTYAGLINEQSDRLGNMIEEILLYSKFEDKRGGHDSPEQVKSELIISEARKTLDAVAEAGGIKLKWDVSGLPEIIQTYPSVIRLVLNNLVTNAVNHAYSDLTRSSDVRVRIRYIIPEKLSVEVEDDGRGIDAREVKKIFDPFYRDSVSRSRQEKGSGLGLFIAKRKVQLAGGKLQVESPYKRIDGVRNSGCRFSLILPCNVPEDNSDG